LYHDNVTRVEYSVSIKASSICVLTEAIHEVQRQDSHIVIKLLASFRGINEEEDLGKLEELKGLLVSIPHLRKLIAGIDLVSDELSRTGMPFGLQKFLNAAVQFQWGIRIHLGEAIGQRSQG